MQVGVNYPWRDYGWDFGIAPPRWRAPGSPPRWYAEIDAHLQRFRDLGIEVVRWFVLADGLTYGTGPDAPRPDPDDSWHFDPPPVSSDLLQHFEELLRRFDAATGTHGTRVQLLPVLIDFHFCKPGRPTGAEGWIKQGRADAVADAVRRERFLDAVLEPLLRISQEHANAIYAWDLVNEPDWVTAGWHPQWWRTPPIDEPAMRAFLEDASARVRRAGFEATVGFARRETAILSGVATGVTQFHHYPRGRDPLRRPPLGEPAVTILGEFATSRADAWPDLPDWDQSVLSRLRLAADNGYPLALPWSFLSVDRHTAWSADVERDIATFTQELTRGGQSPFAAARGKV